MAHEIFFVKLKIEGKMRNMVAPFRLNLSTWIDTNLNGKKEYNCRFYNTWTGDQSMVMGSR